MRTFTVYRRSAPAEYAAAGIANPPDEPQFQGAVFDDGTVAVRWLTEFRSASFWDSLQALEKVHGHPEYETEWAWFGDIAMEKFFTGDDGTGDIEVRRGTGRVLGEYDPVRADGPEPGGGCER
jgi:hypothetical protein